MSSQNWQDYLCNHGQHKERVVLNVPVTQEHKNTISLILSVYTMISTQYHHSVFQAWITLLTEWRKDTWAAVWHFPGFCPSCWEIPKPHSHLDWRHAPRRRSGLLPQVTFEVVYNWKHSHNSVARVGEVNGEQWLMKLNTDIVILARFTTQEQ